MSLTNTIQKISNGWSDYRKYCIKKNTKGTEIKVVKSDHDYYDLVINRWKKEVANIVNSKKFLVKSSLGEGNLSAGPWLAIMDKSITNSARRGFYVVYLFSRSTKKLYLSIGIGAYQFELEYGKATLEVHKDSIQPKEKVLIIDDLIATGGTAEAGAKLVEKSGGVVAGFIFVINLFDLGGKKLLDDKGYKTLSLIDFPGH